MANSNKELISSFEDKLRHLLSLYNAEKQKNIQLVNDINEQEIKLLTLEEKHKQLETNYTHLKTALTINPNREDTKETKERLSSLVREVDKCITLLNDLM